MTLYEQKLEAEKAHKKAQLAELNRVFRMVFQNLSRVDYRTDFNWIFFVVHTGFSLSSLGTKTYREPLFDEKLISVADIRRAAPGYGMCLIDTPNDDKDWTNCYLKFDSDFVMNYQPEFEETTTTSKFLFWTFSDTRRVPKTSKDELKLAILDTYPKYSDEQISAFIAREATERSGKYKLFVKMNDMRYQSTVDYAKRNPQELTYQFRPDNLYPGVRLTIKK